MNNIIHLITNGIKKVLVVFFLCVSSASMPHSAAQDSSRFYVKLYHSVDASDASAIAKLESCSRYFEQTKDTVWLVKSL